MENRTVGDWLGELASGASTPGGGAAAALNAAVGTALVSMVCNLTIGKPKFAAHEDALKVTLARAEELRRQAVGLADEDERAFGNVVAAYKLPKATDEEKRARSAAIQDALVGAADVPLRTAALAAEVIDLAGSIVDTSNPNVLSDVAVAAASAKSALSSAVVNVEVNLASMTAGERRDTFAARIAEHAAAAERADAVIRLVRERIAA
ncbi:cyclodeaminase/cyclohydrolase family protein [Amycolatopsis sp. cmx-4-83]|uniref:cyclodeaminase/cyclohydrolase family protein n=1 Tax=Amycolatopsis sp. cmx-4-83 TaxID=2790940 RepID=UPI00397BF795